MDWLSKDKNYIWHPYTTQKSAPDPVYIDKGEGCWLIDGQGNRYLDAISSWWVNLHGHANPYIAEKIYQQALRLEHIIFAGFTHQPAIELAERLLPLLPGQLSKIFYSDNGSTATEVALKMAIQYWWNLKDTGSPTGKRKKLLAFRNAYHGDTFGAMSVSDRSVFTLAFQDFLFEVIFIDTPVPENIDKLKELVRRQGDSIAAFIYEPLVQGAGGMKMYDAILMNELLKVVKEQEIVCIADEVMTGFGRTGQLFASSSMEETPDIICLSKGLTGGVMALGATVCNARIYEAYVSDDKKKTFFHGHSFTANPLACTAALASLDLLLEENTRSRIENITKMNTGFADHLRDWFTKKGVISAPRQAGTILAFDINQGDPVYLNQVSALFTSASMKQKVFLRPLGNTVYFMPPYCMTRSEYDLLSSVTENIISNINNI